MHDVKPAPWYTNSDESSAISLEPQDECNLIGAKQYVCVTAATCKFRCLTDKVLWRHMQETHRDCSAYVCHLCFVSAETRHFLLEHYRSIHDYRAVECLYCDFGANDNWLVMGHIMDRHPDRPFKMLVRAGNSIDVLQELRNLAASYLTKGPVPPAQLPVQDSPQVLLVPSVQTEQQDINIPAQLPCTSLPSQNQPCPAGDDEPMCDVNEQRPATCEPLEEGLVRNSATISGVTLPHHGTDVLGSCGAEGLQTSSFACAQESSAAGPSCQELPSPVSNVETSSHTNSSCFVCNVGSCGIAFEEILDFMNHLAECHPSESSFVCPKCALFVNSSADLLAHLVDNHTGVLFCPYKDCTFGSLHQSGVDIHIIQVHQVYQPDQSNTGNSPAGADTRDESDIWSESLRSSPAVDCPERLDASPVEEGCPYEEVVDHTQREGSTENAMDDFKITLNLCSKCRLYFSTAGRYIQHMTLVHMVEFFCGYCLKAYKKSRCLFMHIGCQHSGQMLSVKCFKDQKVVDVGPQVLPLWIEDAREYLERGQFETMGLRGKAMVKKLKKTIAFMASVGSDLEMELPEPTATHGKVAGHPRQAQPVPPLSTLCTAQRTGSKHMKEQTKEHSVQGQSWSSHAPSERDLIEEHLSGHFSAYSDPAGDFVKLHPEVMDTSSLSGEPSFTSSQSKRVNLRVHASAYVDPRYYKKVDGKIVVDECVWQKLLVLSAANQPISKGSLLEGSHSLLSETTEKCHQCFKCSLHFPSFETLGQHVVQHHKDRLISRRCTATVLGKKSKWLTKVSPVSDVSEDVKPFSTAPSWLNSSVHAESSTSDPSYKQVQIKTRECSNDNQKLFVRLSTRDVRVPYNQFARLMNVSPVVKLCKLPTIKSEPV